MARVRSITSFNLALPALERCERPRQASWSASSDHPGRLAQGPDEKQGLAGRASGFMAYSFQNSCDPLGGRVPRGKLVRGNDAVNHRGRAEVSQWCPSSQPYPGCRRARCIDVKVITSSPRWFLIQYLIRSMPRSGLKRDGVFSTT